ncbi:MAG: SRPBCC family protein [Verrucomicrobiota bacterium]
MITIRDSITLDCSAEVLWYLLEDPGLMQEWNPKVKDWEALSTGKMGPGYEFKLLYGMRSKLTWCNVKVAQYRPHRQLVWEVQPPEAKNIEATRLSFDLEVTALHQTRLTQTVEMPDALIPLPWRWLAKFILRFGKRQGKGQLERLSELVNELGQTAKS